MVNGVNVIGVRYSYVNGFISNVGLFGEVEFGINRNLVGLEFLECKWLLDF